MRSAAAALSLFLAHLMAPASSAAVVTFDNSAGVFAWAGQPTFPEFPGTPLDITQPPSQSGAVPIERALWSQPTFRASSAQEQTDFVSGISRYTAGGQARFARSSAMYTVPGVGSRPAFDMHGLQRFSPGSAIGPGEVWESTVASGFGPLSINYLPTAQRSIIGVQFPLADGLHYGYLDASVGPSGGVTLYGWGYETSPGVPLIVPVPAPTTIVAIAAALPLIARRRRST